MTSFQFDAVRQDGGRIRGRLDAPSVAEAAAILSQRGLFAVEIQAKTRQRGMLAGRIPARALAAAFESLATLIEGGVPVASALHITARGTPGLLGDALHRADGRVREGASFAAALREEPDIPPALLGLVQAGEHGAGLAPVLAQAAEYLHRQAETTASVRAALAYPALLLGVGVVSVCFLGLVVVPRFASLLDDVGAAVPVSTHLLIAVSSTIRRHPVALVLGLGAMTAAIGAGALRWRSAWHAAALQLPVLGALRHGLATARAARTLGSLLQAGVPVLSALRHAAAAAGDREVASRIERAAARVAEGAAMSEALAREVAFAPSCTELTRIGESSGRLAALLTRGASLEERRVERTIHLLVSLLEPALILVFAGLVALVAAGLLQAIYSIRPEAW